MEIKKIEGLVAAPFTPMHKDGSLNLSLVPDYYQLLKANKINGAFICGSTGEGVSLTKEEKQQLAKAWALAAAEDPQFKVMLLVGGTCLQDCIDLAKSAASLGLYAVSFTAPFYFKPSNVTTLEACCKAVADAVPDMQFYYYHIPVLTGVDLPMAALLQRVSNSIPNFAGIKYTHEDFTDFLSCVNYNNGHYDMLWGRDETFLAALALGAKGAVGSTFNYAAPLYHDMINAFEKGDLTLAQHLQQRSIDMINLLRTYGGIATGKAYMKLIGLDCGEFRLPVENMTIDKYSDFKREVEALDFSSFKSLWPNA